MIDRRLVLKLLSTAALMDLAGPAAANEFAGKSGRIIAPFSPGGPADTLSRVMAEGYRRHLGVTYIVENKVGATGNIGASEVARSNPDGLTLLVTNTSLVMNPFLFKKTKVVDPFAELLPVTALATTTFAFVIPGNSPETTFEGWVNRVRKTGRATYGSFGVGSANHLYGFALGKKLGINLDHIPYKGDGPALTDLMNGIIDCGFFSVGSVSELVKSGKLRALAVTGDEPNTVVRNVPTFFGLGISDYGKGGWLGIFAPAGTSEALRITLADATATTLSEPVVNARLGAFGFNLMSSTPTQFAEMVRDESERQAQRIAESGASLD
ncbi:Bug family tripartite tricarboxylate transporter substrate binding protein [Bradyrhizobium manausense]